MGDMKLFLLFVTYAGIHFCLANESKITCNFETDCQWYSSLTPDKTVAWRKSELQNGLYKTNAMCLISVNEDKRLSVTEGNYLDTLLNEIELPSNGTMYCLELEYRNLANAKVDLLIKSQGPEGSFSRQVNLIKRDSAPWASVSVKFVPNTSFKLAFIGNMSLNSGMGICLDNITLTKGKCLSDNVQTNPGSSSQKDRNDFSKSESSMSMTYQQRMIDNQYIQVINKLFSIERGNSQFREKMLSLQQQRLGIQSRMQTLQEESNGYLKQLLQMMKNVVTKLDDN